MTTAIAPAPEPTAAPVTNYRVGAIRSANSNAVQLFGYGVYQGDEIPPADIGSIGVPNPKILLDSGEVVWGCECWWGPEEQVKGSIGKREVVNVTVADFRKEKKEHTEAVEGLIAAFMLANNGQLDEAMIAESVRSGRTLAIGRMTTEDARAWRKWLDEELDRRRAVIV